MRPEEACRFGREVEVGSDDVEGTGLEERLRKFDFLG